MPPYDTIMQEVGYIAPLSKQWNPQLPWTHEFGQEWLAGSVAYVFQKPERERPTRVVVSGAGVMGDAWEIGTHHVLREDQWNKFLGAYEVVGIVMYDDAGAMCWWGGDVPARKLATAVFK